MLEKLMFVRSRMKLLMGVLADSFHCSPVVVWLCFQVPLA
ncbi:hypothetical protein BSU04_37720 [Caballeronia sordidicola]|uniref:Uncharacterized protein n=1 Tax=Caballeronia sordidicola TaxID=196367 RepID=A0A226WPR9_CABSO|nr:hypothetical protein BSU04_37720 [Caballeronia sordidicola]